LEVVVVEGGGGGVVVDVIDGVDVAGFCSGFGDGIADSNGDGDGDGGNGDGNGEGNGDGNGDGVSRISADLVCRLSSIVTYFLGFDKYDVTKVRGRHNEQ
jgi:hypothetical protein